MTVKMTISLRDETAAYVRANATGNASAFIEQAVRAKMLADALAVHPGHDWDDAFAGHDGLGGRRGAE